MPSLLLSPLFLLAFHDGPPPATLASASNSSTLAGANPTATFTVTFTGEPSPANPNGGTTSTFTAELFLDRLPITVSNFIDLAQSGFYNGIHFHRVIPGFMDQFGCPFAKEAHSPRAGTGGPQDGSFKNLVTGRDEFRANGGNIVDELISRDSNKAGTIAMANTGQPNSGGSQMFFNVADNVNLDWFDASTPSKHPVFGKVTDGYDVLVTISQVQTQNDNPIAPIRMEQIEIHGVSGR
jgi:cyclophilin family peptidyl-prolyl cis-trans isomerase